MSNTNTRVPEKLSYPFQASDDAEDSPTHPEQTLNLSGRFSGLNVSSATAQERHIPRQQYTHQPIHTHRVSQPQQNITVDDRYAAIDKLIKYMIKETQPQLVTCLADQLNMKEGNVWHYMVNNQSSPSEALYKTLVSSYNRLRWKHELLALTSAIHETMEPIFNQQMSGQPPSYNESLQPEPNLPEFNFSASESQSPVKNGDIYKIAVDQLIRFTTEDSKERLIDSLTQHLKYSNRNTVNNLFYDKKRESASEFLFQVFYSALKSNRSITDTKQNLANVVRAIIRDMQTSTSATAPNHPEHSSTRVVLPSYEQAVRSSGNSHHCSASTSTANPIHSASTLPQKTTVNTDIMNRLTNHWDVFVEENRDNFLNLQSSRLVEADFQEDSTINNALSNLAFATDVTFEELKALFIGHNSDQAFQKLMQSTNLSPELLLQTIERLCVSQGDIYS
ncbi:hypothetical protein [Endozoicomonas ascidiicola]|uniref:hypothetical protein n=1 Tax=Endozoicomonas ascidiicola TaxID=1698521 RepID=UPI00082ECB36|nr:hypothetical protein [Endozoicomonas ascidiicola]